jgi:hypothetical protein
LLAVSRKRDEPSQMQCLHILQGKILEQKKSAGSVLNRAAVAGANSPHTITKRRTTMTIFKALIAAALVSMTAISSASAQLPTWANSNPASFQAQYPNRDVLNGGALTPAGRIGLERANGAAPVFRGYHAYAADRAARFTR